MTAAWLEICRATFYSRLQLQFPLSANRTAFIPRVPPASLSTAFTCYALASSTSPCPHGLQKLSTAPTLAAPLSNSHHLPLALSLSTHLYSPSSLFVHLQIVNSTRPSVSLSSRIIIHHSRFSQHNSPYSSYKLKLVLLRSNKTSQSIRLYCDANLSAM
jgi:hypothetical protein